VARWMVVAIFLLVSSSGRCEGVSVGDLALGRSVHAGPLAARIAEHESRQHGARTFDVSVPFLGSPVVAHVFVNSEERIQQIEIRLPLARLGEVKRQLIQQFDHPKSDSTSPSAFGLAAWERRDKETVVGLFSEPENDSTLLVVFIWIAPAVDHAQIAVGDDQILGSGSFATVMVCSPAFSERGQSESQRFSTAASKRPANSENILRMLVAGESARWLSFPVGVSSSAAAL
jgi:hypothetical protein